MRFSVVASVLLHGCVLGLAFVSLPESWRTHVEPEPIIPVSLIREAELAPRAPVMRSEEPESFERLAARPRTTPHATPRPRPPSPPWPSRS